MKRAFLTTVIIVHLSWVCLGQERYDIIQGSEVKLVHIASGRSIYPDQITKAEIIRIFGTPERVILKNLSWDFELCYYGKSYFEIPISREYPYSYWLNDSSFKLIIKECLDVKVGSSIDDIIKCFPNSAKHLSNYDQGYSSLILQYAIKEDGQVIITDSNIAIKFSKGDNKIVQIFESTRD